jgi:hypothetical protein
MLVLPCTGDDPETGKPEIMNYHLTKWGVYSLDQKCSYYLFKLLFFGINE